MKRDFQYTIFIGKSSEEVWNALTCKQVIDRYHMAPVLLLELRAGGRISHGKDSEMMTGTILEIDPPKKLVHTFRFAGSSDPESTVIYEIDAVGGEICALHITHTGFPEEESRTHADICGGWPVIASSLKTWLETGKALPWPQ